MDNEQPNPIELSTHSQKTREESPLQISPIFETSPYINSITFIVRIIIERGEFQVPS